MERTAAAGNAQGNWAPAVAGGYSAPVEAEGPSQL